MRNSARPGQSIRCWWTDPDAVRGATTAVSLHSHTHHSRESFEFLPRYLSKVRPVWAAVRALENRHYRRTGKTIRYEGAFWRPPLHPLGAYELEAGQIREKLGLDPLVSITDHDDIEACAELRAIGVDVPFSHEWTVNYDETVFHIGVHNLPPDDARELFGRMERLTADPSPERLTPILRDLDAMPGVLLVLNHPLSNENRCGFRQHLRLLQRFIRDNVKYFHALELNGLQPARHNRRVAEMAAALGLPAISGGDRHCVEPNANVNLTQAKTFDEFVDEIRRERVSHVLYMPQYKESIACRYIEFIWQAVQNYPELQGSVRWVDRLFYDGGTGLNPFSVCWPNGGPWPVRTFISVVGFLAHPRMRATLRMALGGQSEAGA
jgi:hypothetical protein